MYENGEWRRFHDEWVQSLYHSLNVVRVTKTKRLRWDEHVARNAFKIVTGRPKSIEKRPIGKPRRRWENNIGS